MGIPLYLHLTSSLPEPWKTALGTVLIAAWIAAGIGLAFNLRRDLTPVVLEDDSVRVGRSKIRYEDIEAIHQRPGKTVFRLTLTGRKLGRYLSKIDMADEEAFFTELREKTQS